MLVDNFCLLPISRKHLDFTETDVESVDNLSTQSVDKWTSSIFQKHAVDNSLCNYRQPLKFCTNYESFPQFWPIYPRRDRSMVGKNPHQVIHHLWKVWITYPHFVWISYVLKCMNVWEWYCHYHFLKQPAVFAFFACRILFLCCYSVEVVDKLSTHSVDNWDSDEKYSDYIFSSYYSVESVDKLSTHSVDKFWLQW